MYRRSSLFLVLFSGITFLFCSCSSVEKGAGSVADNAGSVLDHIGDSLWIDPDAAGDPAAEETSSADKPQRKKRSPQRERFPETGEQEEDNSFKGAERPESF